MIGEKLGNRYEVVRELGRGGMGVVYLGRDPLLEREVALKLIAAHALTPELRYRFLREARVIAKMDHPGIVSVYDIGEHDDSLFFVMPFVPGTNLREVLEEGSLSLGQLVELGIQGAEALDYSHAHGVVHRDIKPENIMVLREGTETIRIRITDFGLAVAASEHRLTRSGALIGTVSYLSPEQVAGQPADARVDIYAFGTALYECLAGAPPFTGDVQSILYRIAHEQPRPLSAFVVDMDEELDRVIMACLEKDPQKRTPRAKDLAQALVRCRAKIATSGRAGSVLTTVHRQGALRPVPHSPFIGRDREFAELQARLNAAIGGESQLVLVKGEPGIGKTRLLEELDRLAQARQIRVLEGHFAEPNEAFPYQGFCEILESFLRRSQGRPSAPVDLSDLEADLVALFPVLGEIGFTRTPGLLSARSQPPASRRDQDRSAVFELLARALARIGNGAPLVLLLEDLHAATVSVEALQYIARRLGSTPTLLVGTFTSTEVDRAHALTKLIDGFKGNKRFVEIELARLGFAEHRALVEMLTVGVRVDDALAARLYDAAEGNPFFTRELVRSLVDSGAIVRDSHGSLTLPDERGLSFDSLPETVQKAVERRVERLPDELRHVLSMASVLGKSFEERELDAVLEDDHLDDALEKLIRGGFLEEQRKGRGDRLAFTSTAIRDVLYTAIPRRKRRSLHRRVAEELERRHQGRLERVYPQLVYHYTQADVAEKVLEYGLPLARTALAAFSADDVIRATKAVLGFVEDDEPEPLAGEARALLAAAYRMTGDLEAALKEIELAVRTCEKAGDGARALQAIVTAADIAWEGRRVADAKRWVDKGLKAARAANDARALTRLLALGITVANLRGDGAAAREFLEEAERLRPGPAEAERRDAHGGEVQVGLTGSLRAREPVDVTFEEELEVLANVFETLLVTDEQGNLAPALCEHWEAHDGGARFSFTLRPNVKLPSGGRLTARDVKASFERSARVATGELPPALAAIRGLRAARGGPIDAIAIDGELSLGIHLEEPLPIYPALLTDGRAAISLDGAGTGPFRVRSFDAARVVLERNDAYWREPRAAVDAVAFHVEATSADVASGLRAGRFDLALDLLPQDIEEAVRERRASIVEAPKKNVYFAQFNAASAIGRNDAVRAALFGTVQPRDLVWRHLGRLGQPAVGLIPPGVLGHDAGRRQPLVSHEAALELLARSGLTTPLRLRASVQPILLDRFKAITLALLDAWRALGVVVDIVSHDVASFLASLARPDEIDVVLQRWTADYADPDTFTFGLFHSGLGQSRAFNSSAELDRLMLDARLEESPKKRAAMYRKIEESLLHAYRVLPLWHDRDCRLAGPKLRDVTVIPRPPYVSYATLHKSGEASRAGARTGRGGTLTLPICDRLASFDPIPAITAEQGDALACCFETLTREVKGARIVPWLAASFDMEEKGRLFRCRLRDNVRFHDGRRLTSRDVRYSLERFLRDPNSAYRNSLSPIVGAKRLLAGEATELSGLRILSDLELTLELESPLAFFPALLANASTSIVPEGASRFDQSWRDGCVGTGPFRVLRFDPNRRAELEANPEYWREGYPKADGAIVLYGLSPAEIHTRFRAGQCSVATRLPSLEVDALRQDPAFAAGYRETPTLSTYCLFFNVRSGAFTNVDLRRQLCAAIDVDAVRRTLGRHVVEARTFLPPELLGPDSIERDRPSATTGRVCNLEVTCLVHPAFEAEFAPAARVLFAELARLGVRLRTHTGMFNEQRKADVDLYAGRWIGDYPDPDTFTYGVLHSEAGAFAEMCGNAPVDSLSERARAESDPRTRHLLYRDIEQLLRDDAMLLPLFHDKHYAFAAPRVRGFDDALGTTTRGIDYAALWIDD